METGDGTMQRLMDNGQCPKCRTFMDYEKNLTATCGSCGLVVISPIEKAARDELVKDIYDGIKGWGYYKMDHMIEWAADIIEENMMTIDDLDDVCEAYGDQLQDDDDTELLSIIRGLLEEEIEIEIIFDDDEKK